MSVVSIMDPKEKTAGETLKMGVGLIFSFAADMAVTAMLKQHVPAGKGLMRIMTKLGIFAIGMKVGEDVENYFYKIVDDTTAAMKEAKEEAKVMVLEAAKEEGANAK